MPMSAENRAAASERMKAMLAKRRAAKTAAPPVDPAVQEAMAKAPITGVARSANGGPEPAISPPMPWEESHIVIEVDWEHMPMGQAQQFYAHLKEEFEKAGKILNARSMAHVSGFTCFMCHKHFDGNPGFTDYSYIDPTTGLSPRVDCCGELCVINYHKHRIDMRLAVEMKRGAEQRGE